jgi:hypothetical protein
MTGLLIIFGSVAIYTLIYYLITRKGQPDVP